MRGRESFSLPADRPAALDPSGRPFAPETQLLPGVEAAVEDVEVVGLIHRLPDGSGRLERVGVCNVSGTIYREVLLHGPVQLMYLWAGLNALGFTQRQPTQAGGFSKYRVLFTRTPGEKRPPGGGGLK